MECDSKRILKRRRRRFLILTVGRVWTFYLKVCCPSVSLYYSALVNPEKRRWRWSELQTRSAAYQVSIQSDRPSVCVFAVCVSAGVCVCRCVCLQVCVSAGVCVCGGVSNRISSSSVASPGLLGSHTVFVLLFTFSHWTVSCHTCSWWLFSFWIHLLIIVSMNQQTATVWWK